MLNPALLTFLLGFSFSLLELLSTQLLHHSFLKSFVFLIPELSHLFKEFLLPILLPPLLSVLSSLCSLGILLRIRLSWLGRDRGRS